MVLSIAATLVARSISVPHTSHILSTYLNSRSDRRFPPEPSLADRQRPVVDLPVHWKGNTGFWHEISAVRPRLGWKSTRGASRKDRGDEFQPCAHHAAVPG